MSTHRLFQRALVLSAAAGITGLAGAGIASAHVSANVYGEEPEKGGYGAIVLRVPNEEEDAGTTKLEITFPRDAKISSARTKPVDGWTAKVAKDGDVVTGITWTASKGNEIAAGATSYQEFPFVVGPLPDNTDTLYLDAAQTYSDGKVVEWNQRQQNGAEEPEHPAPEVELAAASEDGHGGSGSATDNTENTENTDAQATSSATDDTARWLGGAGILVGALGLGVGAGATIRARKRG